MSENQVITGQCLCGEVAFTVAGKLPALYQCHCSLCRKVSGSSSNSATFISKQHFKWVRGQRSITKYRKASGFQSHFCKHCGCVLPNLLGNDQAVWVPVGLLENSDELKVAAHLYVDSKAKWHAIGGEAAQYATMPEFVELYNVLHHQ